MKKAFGFLLLACVMALTCIAAAETAGTAYPIDFGDFSMVIDPDKPCQEGEKADNAVMLVLYPAYNAIGDTNTNFNIVWSSSDANIGSFQDSDREALFGMLENQISTQYEALGFSMTGFSVSDVELISIDGKPALTYRMAYSISNDSVSGDLIQVQAIVSDSSFGTYTFTGTAQSTELLETYVKPLLDAVTWN